MSEKELGVYKCVARNGVGNASIHFKLESTY